MKRLVIALALVLQATVSASDGEPQQQTEGHGGSRPGPQSPTAEALLRSFDERRAHLLPQPFVALRIAMWNTMLQPWLPYEDRVIKEASWLFPVPREGTEHQRLHLLCHQHRNRHEDPRAACVPDRSGLPIPGAEHRLGESALL